MADWSSTVQPRRVLGIDTGFAHIGYALIEVDDFARQTLVDYGVWDMHSAYERMNERSVHAMRQLNTILDKLKFDGIVLETVPGGKTKFNAKDATLATTNFFRSYCIIHGLDYAEAMSRTFKSFVTGSSTASKDDMKAAAIARFPELHDDLRYDTYDAVCIAVRGATPGYERWGYAR